MLMVSPSQLSFLSSALPSSCQWHGRSCTHVTATRKTTQEGCCLGNWAATAQFSFLPPSLIHNSSCFFYLYIKLTLEVGKWKENECHAGTYFFTTLLFTPDSDPNPTIGSTWPAVLIEIWDEGVGYKQQFCHAALLGHGPLPFTAYMFLTSGCATHTTLQKEPYKAGSWKRLAELPRNWSQCLNQSAVSNIYKIK